MKHVNKLKFIVCAIGVLAGAAVLAVSSILRKLLPTALESISESIQNGTLPIRLDRDLMIVTVLGIILIAFAVAYGIFCLVTAKKDK